MTGAACLWVFVACCFGIPAAIIIISMGFHAIEGDLDWKGALAGFAVCLFASVGAITSAYCCHKCYDVNFAVAMKNINYTRTTEVNTQIEMNYQDVANEKK